MNTTRPNDNVPADDLDKTPPDKPSPRAFATATGTVFQTVGTVFLLGSCCFWWFSDRLVPRVEGGIDRWTDLFTIEHAPIAALGVGALTTLVGGLAFIAVGVGLTGEKRRSGTLATFISLVMACVYWALSGVLALAVGSVATATVAAIFGAVCTVLFLLAGHSASVLKSFPPPPDQDAATDEILEEHRRKRAERLKDYDP